MSPMTSQITSLTIVYSTVYSGADQRKHQSSASLPLWGEFTDNRWIPHKGPVTRKMFPFDDVIMWWFTLIHFASWFLLPALPLNYALSCSENGLVPQARLKTIFSQNKPIFKQKMSLKMPRCLQNIGHLSGPVRHTLYPLKYARGLAVLCFVVVII